MYCDVHYFLVKFEIKIQLVYGGKKTQIVDMGKMD